MPRPMTPEEFAALPPFQKGYVVYMAGAREDQPNIPETYVPAEGEREEYERGQWQAVLEVQDLDS